MTQRLTSSSICRSVTYILWSSDFALYLEDCLIEKCCTWDNGSLSLLFIIVIDLNYLYTLRNGAGCGYLCPIRHLL